MVTQVDPIVEAVNSRIKAEIKAFVIAAKRPEFVTQRTITDVLSMPSADYLEHGREGAYETWKDRRLVYARTEDVAAFIQSHPVAPRAANDVEGSAREAEAFAISGARRVSR